MYLLTTGLNPTEDFIQHHGVLGMKWGVHRYRDKGGNITKRGKKRFEKVSKDPKKQAKDQQRGKNITYWAMDDMYMYGEKSKKINKMYKLYDAINNGTVKAGKDFIVQRDINLKLTGLKFDNKLIANPDSKKMKEYTDGLDLDKYGSLKTQVYFSDGAAWVSEHLNT